MTNRWTSPTRRMFLGGAGATLALSSGLPRLARAQDTLDWKQFDGSHIEVSLVKSPRADTIERNLAAFTEMTGIDVGFEQIPEQQQRQKVVVEFASGAPSFDVVQLSYHVQKRQFEKAGWLADLRPMLADPKLADPSLSIDDFSAAGQAYATGPNGEFHSLPISVDYWIIYWNQELFAQKGLSYPTSFDELVSAAEALTDLAAGTYGFVARGLKNANVPVWTSFLLGYGAEPIDANGELQTAGDAAVKAATMYQRLLTKSAPPGVVGFNWSECQSSFLQGKIGMWLDGVGFAPPLEDPSKSLVVGKVGYGVVPPGPGGHASATFGDGIGISAVSENKGPAFLFAQWAVSHAIQADLLQTGSGVPFRTSVVDDPEVRANLKLPQGWIEAVAGSAEISKFGLPVIVPVTEFRDVIGTALTNLLGGADAATEMKRATAEFKPVLDKSEAS